MTAAGEAPSAGETVVVLADDLIWATRLVGQLRTLGAHPVRASSIAGLDSALAGGVGGDPRPTRAVVDLTARAYDGVAGVTRAAGAGLRVLGVGQHDDVPRRRAALAAGAERVYAYRKLFEDGHATLASWLGIPAPGLGTLAVPQAGDG